MATGDLISNARAKTSLPLAVAADDATINTLITAVSQYIRTYCRRDFALTSYDELYSGDGGRYLMLRQYPLQTVTSVRYRPVTVMKIINNATSINQQARVSVVNTGLQLQVVASGVKTTTTAGLTFAGNPTLNSLATAVTALGNGWSAQIVGDSGQGSGTGDYGLWPSADLYVPPRFGDGTGGQGALTARGQFAELKMHTYELAGYQWDARGWLLRAIPYTDPELLHPEDLVWPNGVNNFRIQYSAGYTTVPEGVQEACAEWVAALFWQTKEDPTLRSTTPPPHVLFLLEPFRSHPIG